MNYDKATESVQLLNLKLDANGLIPAIIQDDVNDQVLMMAYMSLESLSISIAEQRTCFGLEADRSYGAKEIQVDIYS